jgi:hypothetical protein
VSYYHLSCNRSLKNSIRRRIFILEIYKCWQTILQCRYISNIEMAGGKVVYVPLRPPPNASSKTTSASEWAVDMAELQTAFTSRTKMLVSFEICRRQDF